MEQLSPVELQAWLSEHPNWSLDAGRRIVRWYENGSFTDAIRFVERVADAAEAADHHPDIDIRYRRVLVGLVTHDAGGITQKDLDLAESIDGKFGE